MLANLLHFSYSGSKKGLSFAEAFAIVSQYKLKLGSIPSLLLPSQSARALCFVLGTAGLLIFEFYAALLTSYMTISNPSMSITELADIITQGYSLYVWRDTNLAESFSKVSAVKLHVFFIQ